MISKVTDFTDYRTEKIQNHQMLMEAARLGSDLFNSMEDSAKKFGEPGDAKTREYIDKVMAMMFVKFTGRDQWITLHELHQTLEKVALQRQQKTYLDAVVEIMNNGRSLFDEY
jgi:hypothetical protein